MSFSIVSIEAGQFNMIKQLVKDVRDIRNLMTPPQEDNPKKEKIVESGTISGSTGLDAAFADLSDNLNISNKPIVYDGSDGTLKDTREDTAVDLRNNDDQGNTAKEEKKYGA